MKKRMLIIENAGAPEGLVFLNFKSKAALPAPADVPTLIPNGAMDFGQDPFFKVEAIDFPATGSGGVYDGSFFKSFINVTKDRPIPGSKRGHTYDSRPPSDFYTVGGRIDSQDNGKTGTAFLKIFIPPMGDPTENAAFIRDAKAGIVHFSLVTRPDYAVKSEKDPAGNPIQVRHFTASMGAERNDAMEYGAGAMSQIVNSSSFSLDVEAAEALIASGHFDKDSKIEGDAIQNGIVYRHALRLMASRVSDQDRPVISRLISEIDRSPTKRNGGNSVNKEELFATLKNMVANAQTTLVEIANAIGLGALVRNSEDEANAETVKALNAKLGVTEKPIERLEAVLIENKANQAAAVELAVNEIAGEKTLKNAANQDVENPGHAYAAQKCAGLSGEALKNAVEALKKDATMLALNGLRADGESGINRVVNGGKKTAVASNSGDDIPTISVGAKE